MSREHKARVERVNYETVSNRTEITVSIPGEVRPERSEIVVVTLSEGKK